MPSACRPCSSTVGHDEWVTPTQLTARAMLAAFLGPQTEPVPLDSEVLESIELDGYVREKVLYSTAPGIKVSAYVCRPRTRAGAVPGVYVTISTLVTSPWARASRSASPATRVWPMQPSWRRKAW